MPRPSKVQHPLSHGPSKEEWAHAHEAIQAEPTLWASLAVDGIQSDGLGGLIEQRRCPCCGSSLSRRTTALGAVETLSTMASVHARSLEAVANAGAAAQGIPRTKS